MAKPSGSRPASKAVVITPNDNIDLNLSSVEMYTQAIYIGGAGDLRVMLLDNTVAVTFVGVKAGGVYPFKIKRVYSTGTTATNLVGLL